MKDRTGTGSSRSKINKGNKKTTTEVAKVVVQQNQQALDQKAPINHTHHIEDMEGYTRNCVVYIDDTGRPDFLALGSSGQYLKSNGNSSAPSWDTPAGGGGGSSAWGSITGTLSNQTDLNSALSGKSDTGHGHSIGDVTNLQTSLDAKAASSHNHSIGEVTNLQTSLDAKAASSHNHAISDVTDLQTTLDGKAASSHTHASYLTDAPSDSNQYARQGGSWEVISGGGTTIDHFQVQDDGTTGQLTTGSYVDLAGIWGTPVVSGSGFSFNAGTGILTITKDVDVAEFDIKVTSWNNANNRHELHAALLRAGSIIIEDKQYASRNNTQDAGSAYIPGFKAFTVANGTEFKVQIRDVGSAATVGASTNVPTMTYISCKLYS